MNARHYLSRVLVETIQTAETTKKTEKFYNSLHFQRVV